MAKKQRHIDLKSKKLSFEEGSSLYSLLSLDTLKMTVEVNVTQGQHTKRQTLAFAHLPKSLKKIINPN